VRQDNDLEVILDYVVRLGEREYLSLGKEVRLFFSLLEIHREQRPLWPI
jgi:hypothetical protein